MSREILRDAASLIRERAKATQRDHLPEWYEVEAVAFKGFPLADREHIAAWGPAAAIAVADWLEVTARDVGTSSFAFHAAVAFALAYLGSES